jgi:hypothetical protein
MQGLVGLGRAIVGFIDRQIASHEYVKGKIFVKEMDKEQSTRVVLGTATGWLVGAG